MGPWWLLHVFFLTSAQGETISEFDSPGPLAVILHLASLHAVGLVLARLLQKLPESLPEKPSLTDDILYEIFSYLDPADAAQAGLVCTRWHRNATHASYREATLDTSSPFSRSLAHTLLHRPDLRHHVRHLTVVHCAPYPQEHLYRWIYHLPPFSLRTCRIFGVPEATEQLRNALAINTTYRTEVANFGYKYSEQVLLNSIAQTNDPVRRQWLCRMLDQGWQLDRRVNQYRAHIEAVSPEHSLPAAIERFSECIWLEAESPAMLQTDVTVLEVKGVSRERVDALVDAFGKYIAAVPCFAVTLTYQVPRVRAVGAGVSSGSGSAHEFANSDAVARDVQRLEPVRCACISPPVDEALPASAVIRGGCGFRNTSLTDAAAKNVVDWVWRDAMPDGRPVNIVNLHIAKYAELVLPDPCATCGLSLFATYYLRCDAPYITHG